MEHWAKLSESHIFRFSELTKREIQVICYLFLKRNGTNKQCNPRRKTIAAGTGIGRSHVTEALAGLVSKQWIAENLETGDFELFDADDIPPPVRSQIGNNVPKSGIPKSGTIAPKSGTICSQNGNRYIEQTTKQKRTARAPRKLKSGPTRIPDPFPLTDEMISWFTDNVPKLRIGPIEAHADFVEYWTNNQTKRATATNWLLRWQKGMRLLLQWQNRDDAKHGVIAGGADWRTVGKHSAADEPAPEPLPDCIVCDPKTRTIPDEPESEYSSLRSLPCPVCQPDAYGRAKDYSDEFRRRLKPGGGRKLTDAFI
jgi:hypothetical protein